LALALHTKPGLAVSAWTVRRGLHALGWVWERAQWVAKDTEPPRGERWARMRWQAAPWTGQEGMVCADALESQRWPQVGAAGRPKGSQEDVMTPGPKEKPSLAGALKLATGTSRHGRGPRQNTA
jgi:hypothetical protein